MKAIFQIDENFKDTHKSEFVTFEGWDGKSYNGEGCNATVFIHKQNGKRYVRTYNRGYRCYHEILSEKHPVSGAYKLETCVFLSNLLINSK